MNFNVTAVWFLIQDHVMQYRTGAVRTFVLPLIYERKWMQNCFQGGLKKEWKDSEMEFKDHPQITLCEDETFHLETCLVAIDPVSNFWSVSFTESTALSAVCSMLYGCTPVALYLRQKRRLPHLGVKKA